MHLYIIGAITTIFASLCAGIDCPCGWRLDGHDAVYTSRLIEDFSQYPDVQSVLNNASAANFNRDFMMYDFWQNSSDPDILNAKYDWRNIEITNKTLLLGQQGYTADDLDAHRPDDSSEIDIEMVTTGDSFVNNTINFTLHPSLAPDGSPIPNATVSRPLVQPGFNPETFHEYRFDCHPGLRVEYFIDGQLVHSNDHNLPTAGGNLQVKLWADGNRWWSGTPSTTDVFMTIKSIVAYYNTSHLDQQWQKTCEAAGGPNNKTICTIT